jgi:HD-GYP domain-containing protein (c-di-GMP phosphodiesterase class II)
MSKTMSRNLHLNSTELLNLGKIFSQMIDFRSRFTATHSTGVSIVAEMLAEFIGFSEEECLVMRLTGKLHDLGKLAMPTEILEKKVT